MRATGFSLNDSGERLANKAIVFSNSVRLLNFVATLIDTKYGYVMHTGSMTQSKRNAAVDAFQTRDDVRVILVSVKTGGVGLTLTAANSVVILDAAWNPATDSQAVDRAVRYGQTRVVHVVRFVVLGTIEEVST